MGKTALRTLAISASVLTALVGQSAHAYDYTAPVPLHTVASFDPSNSVVPFPTNLLLQGTTDLTLNAPVPSSPAQAGLVNALNSLDGFSTIAPWSTTFPAGLTASSVVGGSSVHLYEVTLSGPGGGVTGIVRELASPQEYVATLASNAATGATLAIVPTAPLKQLTSYMAVLTNGITDGAGNAVRASLIYTFAKRTSPLCVNGKTTLPALTDANACALEPLRQLTNSQEAAASAAGVNAANIVLSWTATTQATTVTMQALTGVIDAVPNTNVQVVPTGLDLSKANSALPPIADIYLGGLTIPYYLSPPTATNPTAPLTGFWQAAPGAYVAPFNTYGLDPTSTNVTFANPFPVATSNQTIPVIATVPNASSGKTKPASGWPVVIYQHGITSDRETIVAAAAAFAQAGFAMVAIDLPLHGLVNTADPFYDNQVLKLVYAGKSMSGPAFNVSERTFNLDLENNSTGASGPDGQIDPSGAYFINLTSVRTSRDNLREGVADMLELRSAIPAIMDTDGTPLFNAASVNFLGLSLGSIEGITFLSLASAPNLAVQTGVINVPGGGITGLVLGSPSISPQIFSGLAAAGIQPGTADFNTFTVVTQSVIDSGDPINYAGDAGLGTVLAGKNILAQEVVGGGAPVTGDASTPSLYDANGKWLPDQVIPNTSPGFPLSGGTPIISVLGLQQRGFCVNCPVYPAGPVHVVVRFTNGVHGSILDPSESPQTTQEMQTEAAGFIGSGGTVVPISNPAVVQQQ